ncbi:MULTISPECIES: MFS transporter [unclassified Herbaspirillum]|uniref:MFS transporter n=1 Tax=unclassified Herbaspirillum TaxID=2624150 RepID=UPI0011670A08|nr:MULTISPECIES: MFS transporter [unclassified Herbaspirillum]MBB5391742.1 D-galactonate transporter [Herbaspirillum sp. SJZ102]TQK03012.1 D-galactonate transporter [Herbaspirillum sp. SJZ130]TQK06600.1 D-galactonate transporter [Herbaspirillum sp. SJZ106]
MSYANPAAAAQPMDGESAVGRRVIAKLHRKIVWYCFFLFMINYLDRVNVGFAALTMNADLGLSAKVYGLGAGIFFLGYIAFEIPSNMILHRVGPRIWIARIMITWGLVGCAMAMIQGAWSFYALRFLLGLAEAGFAPGVLLYMTYWFPKKERGKAVAGFMLATVLSSVVGAPLSGWLLSSTHGWAGLSGWQWMFILEGLPAVIMGVVTLFYLVDRPEQGKWLNAEERQWLTSTLAAEQQSNASHAQHDFATIFRDPRMWILTLIYMFNAVAIYGVVLWLPQIVKSLGGLNNFQTGLVAAIPFICAAVGLVLVARSSDRTGERKLHTACAGLCGGVFLAASALAPSPLLGLVLLCIAAMGLWATLGVFWTLPTQFLAGAAAAGGIAMINGFAQIGGFVGPYLVGWIRESTQSFSTALLVLAMSPIIGFFLCLTLKMRNDRTGR